MSILFITNNLPPILCGVGDYTYKLAQALVKRGFDIHILCSSKLEIKNNVSVFKQEKIIVYPIIEEWTYNGLLNCKGLLEHQNIDVVSLQFVPFAFQKKGLPISLPKGLKSLFPDVYWHIMFHELWVGMESNAKLASKLHGILQRLIIKNILETLKPQLITTNASIYKFQLKRLGYRAKLLPLFGNITISYNAKSNSSNKTVFAVFGGIHYGAPVQAFILELKEYLYNSDKSIQDVEFLFIGKCGSYINEWISVLKESSISYTITGKIAEDEISKYLLKSNYGITTTPFLLTEKSGAVAAMLEHDLKIICIARPWEVNNFNSHQFYFEHSVQYYRKGELHSILGNKIRIVHSEVSAVANTYLKYLNL